MSKEKIRQLLIDEPGISQSEIARRLGVSRQYVNNALKELSVDNIRQLMKLSDPIEQPKKKKRKQPYPKTEEKQIQKLVDRRIDILEQLARANDQAWKMVEELKGLESEVEKFLGNGIKFRRIETILRCMAEIRAQLEFQVEILKTLADMRTVQEFQEEVLAVIAEVEPNAAAEIRRRLIERQALRAAITLN